MKQKLTAAKGFIAGMLVMALLTGTIVMASPEVRELVFGVSIELDGRAMTFAADSQPFIMDNRTFTPARAIAEALGAEVDFVDGTVIITSQAVTPPADASACGCIDCDCAADTSAAAEINPITSADIRDLQRAWGEGLVAISTAYAEDEDYLPIAVNVLDTLYAYASSGLVLFKPTVTEAPYTFRFTEAGAAEYFIGRDRDQDGFALGGWTDVVFDDNGRYIINGETALWMGNVHITNADGDVTTVDKTFGLYRCADGYVRIQLHHSSLPHTS